MVYPMLHGDMRRLFKSCKGFSIAEMIVVAAVMSVLIGFAMIHAPERVASARRQALKQNLSVLRKAIGDFQGDQGRYPYSLVELTVDGPGGYRYLTSIPSDPTTGDMDWTLVVESQNDFYTEDFEAYVSGDTFNDYDGGFIPPEASSALAVRGAVTDTDFREGALSLKVQGNRWCRLDMAPLTLTQDTSIAVWVKISSPSEMNIFGVADGAGKEILYQIAGTEDGSSLVPGGADSKLYEKHRISSIADQSFEWRRFIFHIGTDWYNSFEENGDLEKLYFICDDDGAETGESFFDEVLFFKPQYANGVGMDWTDGIVNIRSSNEEYESW